MLFYSVFKYVPILNNYLNKYLYFLFNLFEQKYYKRMKLIKKKLLRKSKKIIFLKSQLE